jgi:hypothetical protein
MYRGLDRKTIAKVDSMHEINVVALVKGQERYIFLFDDAHRSDALRTLGRFASNKELNFTWYDAAVLSQRIRQTSDHVRHVRARFELPLASDHREEEIG